MDPNANLAEQRRIVANIKSGRAMLYDMERLANLITALDEWLSRGGFLPTAWERKP